MNDQSPCKPIEFAFFQSLPALTISTFKDLVRDFLEIEDKIYAETFNLYACFLKLSYPKVQLRDLFCVKLHTGMILKYSNTEAIKELGQHAFDEYWHMAGDANYWPSGERMPHNLLPYLEVVQKWQQSNKNRIIDCELKLKDFRETLES